MTTIKIADHLNALGLPPSYFIDSLTTGRRKKETVAWYATRSKRLWKSRILDLFWRNIISLNDVELQLNKISQEKYVIQERITIINKKKKAVSNVFATQASAKKLLNHLKDKISSTFNRRSDTFCWFLDCSIGQTDDFKTRQPIDYIHFYLKRIPFTPNVVEPYVWANNEKPPQSVIFPHI